MPRAKKQPIERSCLHCNAQFTTTYSRQVYCSRACQSAARHQNDAKAPQASQGLRSTSRQDRRNAERRATQEWMYELVFGTHPEYRADVLMGLLVFAATSTGPSAKRYRDVLTYPSAQRSHPLSAAARGTSHLHHRSQPLSYPVTLAAMANHVCKFHLGITSRTFIKEAKEDGVAMSDMQEVYDDLMDSTKPQPVIQGCDVEGSINGPHRPPTLSQIVHAEYVINDPLGAAKRTSEASQRRLAA